MNTLFSNKKKKSWIAKLTDVNRKKVTNKHKQWFSKHKKYSSFDVGHVGNYETLKKRLMTNTLNISNFMPGEDEHATISITDEGNKKYL